MAYTDQAATYNMRTTVYDAAIKQIAEPMYKFKQACLISPTSGWNNYFWRENTAILTAATTTGMTSNLGKAIPRGAGFPQASVTMERVLATMQKFGREDFIMWEDLISDDVSVRDRTLYKIAQAVTKDVDDAIWAVLTENIPTTKVITATDIQLISITGPTGKYWNVASSNIIDDLSSCRQKIGEYNYDASDCIAFVSPLDYRSIVNYLAGKGAQFPAIGNSTASSGDVEKLIGIKLVVSNSVTASFALVVKPKVVATWRALVPLTTITKEEPLVKVTIRSAEIGVTELTDPKCAVLIAGTQTPYV